MGAAARCCGQGGAAVGNVLDCNPIALAGESYQGQDYDVSDLGDNTCRCGGEVQTCGVLSSNLQPPEPVGPASAQP